MMHELDRIADYFACEQRKLDYELELALARVEMLRKMKENLSRNHLQAQADYLKRSKAEIFKKDTHENVL
jgi:hypothetical protein